MKDNGVWALPNSWAWTTIGQVAETTSGGTPSRKHPEYYGGEIPWVKSGELNDATVTRVEECITEEGLKQSSAKLFPQGTPVVALYGATVGRTAILGLDASTNQAICAIFALQNAFISSYILYWLQFQRPQLIELSTGGAQPNISQRIVRAFHFPLAPLPEQQRIVAEIETEFTRLDAGVAALKRAQANLRRYKASVLKAACEGHITLEWRKDHHDVEQAANRWQISRAPIVSEDLPELPQTWKYRSLQDISERVSVGHVGPTSQYYCESSQGVPFIRSQNVRQGRLDLEGVRYVTQEFHQKTQKSQLRGGDLLVVRVGANRGDACVVPDAIGELNCANIVFARPYPGVSKFLDLYFQTEGCRNLMLGMTTGSAQGVINTRSVARVPVPLPPEEEQPIIVAEVERRLSVVGELEKQVEAALRRAERLRQAILKHAFEGKLVPQDPNDEPASALLARIKAARSGQGKGAPKGSRQMRLPMP